jgi:hypothetical protein
MIAVPTRSSARRMGLPMIEGNTDNDLSLQPICVNKDRVPCSGKLEPAYPTFTNYGSISKRINLCFIVSYASAVIYNKRRLHGVETAVVVTVERAKAQLRSRSWA